MKKLYTTEEIVKTLENRDSTALADIYKTMEHYSVEWLLIYASLYAQEAVEP